MLVCTYQCILYNFLTSMLWVRILSPDSGAYTTILPMLLRIAFAILLGIPKVGRYVCIAFLHGAYNLPILANRLYLRYYLVQYGTCTL